MLSHTRQPEDLADCIKMIQRAIGLNIPANAMEWINADHNEIDVRYSMVVKDALRAASKSHFDPKKLVKVCYVWSF